MASKKLNNLLQSPQRLGLIGISIVIIVMNVLPPFSTDMMTPAIPTMTELFNSTAERVTLTVTLYFIFFSIGQLGFGSVSDKYGRKRTILSCLVIYVVGAILCAIAPNLAILIAARCVQALGGGGCTSTVIAIIRDIFDDSTREKFLMFTAIVNVLGPVIAPIVGAVIVTSFDWRMVFWVLGAFAVVLIGAFLLYDESLLPENREKGSIFKSYSKIGLFIRNKSFMTVLLCATMSNLIFGCILSIGSYIYITMFGLTEQGFSYYFAAMAIICCIGPAIYTVICDRVKKTAIFWVLLLMPALTCILLIFIGHASATMFFIAFLPTAIAAATLRPMATNILIIEAKDDEAGSASGVINFIKTIGGAVGMIFASMFADFINGLIVISGVATLISIVLWVVFLRSKSMSLKVFDADRKIEKQA